MSTVIIDYQSGNLHSAEKAFQRMARETVAGPVTVTSDPEAIAAADRIVLPGDGAFPACLEGLMAFPGTVEAMRDAVSARGVPFLGICVGMQMLATRGLEYVETPGFDWIGGDVVRITPTDPALKVPHMGWNDLIVDHAHPVLDGVATGDHAYFVHSYRFAATDPDTVLAHADHGGPVAAVIATDTVVGLQFHPEKSQSTGLRIIANFLAWRP